MFGVSYGEYLLLQYGIFFIDANAIFNFVESNYVYLFLVYMVFIGQLRSSVNVISIHVSGFCFFSDYQSILHPCWSRMQFFGGSEISPSPPAPAASGNNGHMMYVFNRNGVCLLYREWNRPLRTLDAQQDHKLMFGLLFSLKSLTAKMDPTRYVCLMDFE